MITAVLIHAFSAQSLAQNCAVPGLQGPATISTAVNTYFAGSGTPAAGATAITLNNGTNASRGVATNLIAGDLVLVMQMQDSSGALAGNFEYAVVTSGGGAGATINLASPLLKSYAQSVTGGAVRTFQVIRVPQYSAATLSGTIDVLPWFIDPVSGAGTGGVFVVDIAGAATMNAATINANGRGFRGGAGVSPGASNTAITSTQANYTCTVALHNGGYKGEGSFATPQKVMGFSASGAVGTITTYDAGGQVFVTTNGYPSCSCGQAALGNGGGGGNDGAPTTGNQRNSGGGGGSNQGAGGTGGRNWNAGTAGGDSTNASLNNPTTTVVGALGGLASGGFGATGLAPDVASKIYLGGGGGGGGANNGSPNLVTTFPPTNSAIIANGASGAVTSSGASGGGIVMIRAGSMAVSAASSINANGLRAYNKNGASDTDAAGGGGAGGTVVIDAGVTAVTLLNVDISGGAGGSSNYFNHGPGGGGGGGLLVASMTGVNSTLTGGATGTDACCGGSPGNGSPKNWGATAGAGALASLPVVISPPGAPRGAQCLPNLTVRKSTSTPIVTTAIGATTTYTINLLNTGGAASNVFLFDTGLPPGWTFLTAPAPVYAYSPAPPFATGNFASGAETTAATGVASPPVLPVDSATTANSVTAVSLRANGAAPGVVATAGQGSLTFGSFFIPQNGSISVTFAVSIPDTATVGTYHNGAGFVFLDPTRTVTTARMLSPPTDVNSNRNALSYSTNNTYQSGGTSTVAGSNYSGLVAGPSNDDVRLMPDLSISKTAPLTATPGTTFSYTITPRNNGRPIGSYSFAITQASDVSTANIPTLLSANPVGITDTLPAGVALGAAFAGTGWTCAGTATTVCALANANAYPIAAATNFATLSAVVTMTVACSPAPSPQTNSVVITAAAGETITGNNTATAITTPSCVSANLSVTKTNAVTSLAAGATTSYTVTFSNSGPAAADNSTVLDGVSAGLVCTTVTCAVTAGGSACPAGLPLGTPVAAGATAFFSTGVLIPTFPGTPASSVTFVVQCAVSATGF